MMLKSVHMCKKTKAVMSGILYHFAENAIIKKIVFALTAIIWKHYAERVFMKK